MSVDLGLWFVDASPLGSSPASWAVAADGLSVLQSRNSDPSLFCSDFETANTDIQGRIRVETRSDDDFVGFALGYSQGDLSSLDASYLLVDWKQRSQTISGCGRVSGPAGLAVSEVFGTPDGSELWSHADLECTLDEGGADAGGLNELQRGFNLGSTGWSDNTDYEFRFVSSPTNLLVYVDGLLELNVTGVFDFTGSICFYNYSQERVRYTAFTRESLPTTSPSSNPSPSPSQLPSIVPSQAPTPSPSSSTSPSRVPSEKPVAPTLRPSTSPVPSGSPSQKLVAAPSSSPSQSSSAPSGAPSDKTASDPTSNPSQSPTCGEGLFGDDCLPLLFLSDITPNRGRDEGGFVVQVKGFNIKDDAEVLCNFGTDTVLGTAVSATEATCVAPAVPGLVGSDGMITVDFSIFVDGEGAANSLPFTFFGTCPPSACVNGFCSSGECFCDAGFVGSSCDEALVLPVLQAIPGVQVVAGDSLQVTPVLEAGSTPTSWTLSSTPVVTDLTIDSQTGVITWERPVAAPAPVSVSVQVENDASSSTQTFQITVLPIYTTANVGTTVTSLATGASTFVPIEGECLYRSNNTAVPFCAAEIFVAQDGFRRVLAVTSDQNGKFRVRYVPNIDDGGTYNFGGQVPGFESDLVSGSFAIFGISVAPQQLVVEGFPQEITVRMGGLVVSSVSTSVPVEILAAKIDSLLPPEISDLSISFSERSLDGGVSSIFADVSINATESVSAILDYTITTNTEAFASGQIRIEIRDPAAKLQANPSSIGILVDRGQQSRVEVSVTNTGNAPTGQMQVVLPSGFDLLEVSSGNVIPSLLPGESFPVSFLSAPTADAPFDTYTGNLAIRSEETSLILDFQVGVTSNLVSSLAVVCQDEYTFFADGEPPVAGAQVRIKNLVTLDVIDNLADSTGTVIFGDLTYGPYEIRVSASNHNQYAEVIELDVPNNIVYAFLSRQLVSYSWTVSPTIVEEVYEIDIQAAFTTYVPAPVIVIDPVQVDVTTLTAGVDQINFKITNYGLIGVNNFDFTLPPVDGLKFVPLKDGPIGDVPGNSTIFYPVKVESNTATTTRHLQSNGRCTSGFTIWSVECNGTQWFREDILYTGTLSTECGKANAIIPRGSSSSSSGSCCVHSGSIRSGPVLEIACECQLAIFECILTILPLPSLARCAINALRCSDKEPLAQIICLAKAVKSCGKKKLKLPKKIRSCADDLLEGCFDIDILRQRHLRGEADSVRRKLQDIELEDRIAAENFQNTSGAIGDLVDVVLHPFGFGDDDFLDELSTDNEALFFDRFDNIVSDDSENKEAISDAEALVLVSSPLEAQSGAILSFVRRWNRSIEYYNQGYFSVDTLPAGSNPDMIDANYIDSKLAKLASATNNALLRGYPDINANWHADGAAVVTAASRARDGVCAKVRIQIKQQAILAREAFEAELQIENAGSEMTNINVTIFITEKASGLQSIDKFVLGDAELVGISGVDGMGTLSPSISGSATWLFLALGDAAPQQPIEYEVSGLLQYFAEGMPTTVNLLPDVIRVSPDPQLELLYFHEYEIFGDDPFTVPIEPSIPYKLAVMVKNIGFGDAIGFRVLSAQPEIIENEKGLLVDFKIVSARVAGKAAEPSLLIDFGTIPKNSTTVGIWELTSSLQGTFSDYTANFTYKGPINDDRLALVKSVDVLELTHCVYIDSGAAALGGGTDDGIPDFLANKLQDIDRLPDTLVSSNSGIESPVFVSIGADIVVSEAVIGQAYDWRVRASLTVPAVPEAIAGPSGDWYYYRFDDPVPDFLMLQSVVRLGSGDEVLLGFNVWRTSKTKRFVDVGDVEERFVHLFDFAAPGEYELRYTTRSNVPLQISVPLATNTSVTLSWISPSETSRFNILSKFSSSPDSTYTLIENSLNSNDLTVYDLAPGSSYTFLIQTLNENGELLSLGTPFDTMTTGSASSMCGNGVEDSGEECDDGNQNDGDCCSSSCTIESAGTICRSVDGGCDVEDVCDGSMPTCGRNEVRPAGYTCGEDSLQGCVLQCSGASAVCPSTCSDTNNSTQSTLLTCTICEDGSAPTTSSVPFVFGDAIGTCGELNLAKSVRVTEQVCQLLQTSAKAICGCGRDLSAAPSTLSFSPSSEPSAAPFDGSNPTGIPTLSPSAPSPTIESDLKCVPIQGESTCTSATKAICTPYRSPDFCPMDESFSLLVKSRELQIRTNLTGVEGDSHWFPILEDRGAAYAFAGSKGVPTPAIFCCMDNMDDLDACFATSAPRTKFVIHVSGVHSNLGTYVFPDGFNDGAELISGLPMSLADVKQSLLSGENTLSKIFVEEFVSGSTKEPKLPTEVKLHFFDGKFESATILLNRNSECACFLEVDENWTRLDKWGCFVPSAPMGLNQDGDSCYDIDFASGEKNPHPLKGFDMCGEVEKPFDDCVWTTLLEHARVLSVDIGVYMRIDLFVTDDNRIYLQEFSSNHNGGLRHCAAKQKIDGCIDSCFLGKSWRNAGGESLYGGPAKPIPEVLASYKSSTEFQERCRIASSGASPDQKCMS